MNADLVLTRGDTVSVRGGRRARVLIPLARTYCGENIAAVEYELDLNCYGNPTALPWCEILKVER